MKILRRHVGFTTNSSASSEWADLAAQYQAMARDGIIVSSSTTSSSTSLASSSSSGTSSSSTTSSSASGNSSTPAATASAQTQTHVQTQTQAPTPKPTHLWDNIGVIGGILLTVIGIFALERFIRRTLKKRGTNDDV